jgi:hypothetical protein
MAFFIICRTWSCIIGATSLSISFLPPLCDFNKIIPQKKHKIKIKIIEFYFDMLYNNIINLERGKFKMAGTLAHLAVADKIYEILGNSAIKNYPLFLGGNLAPDAVHARNDYQRSDKKRSHLCDGIRSYGYGYPDVAQLFYDRVSQFINEYYLPENEKRDLYLGYITHLLVDEIYLLTVYKRLEEHLKNNGANPDEPGFRKSLADEVNNGGHRDFFSDDAYIVDISANDYNFKEDILFALEAVWDYEIKDYVSADEINISKRWVIDKFFKNKPTQNKTDDDIVKSIKLIDHMAESTIKALMERSFI